MLLMVTSSRRLSSITEEPIKVDTQFGLSYRMLFIERGLLVQPSCEWFIVSQPSLTNSKQLAARVYQLY